MPSPLRSFTVYCMVSLVLTTQGCHLIFPFDIRTERDSEAEAGVTDVTGIEDSSTCNEDQALSPLVAECEDTTSCTLGGDCDGLPAYRDKYSSYCSSLVYEQTFGTDPGAGWELYPSSGTDWVWRCGSLEQRGVDATFKWALARESEGKLKDNGLDYLVEASFQLGAPGDTSDPRWSVGIGARVAVNGTGTDFNYAVCELWVNPNADRRPTSDPDVHLELLNSNAFPMNASPPPAPTPGVEGKEGETYILQMWVTQDVNQLFNPQPTCDDNPCPGVICLLYDATKALRGGYYNLSWGSQYLPATAGVVGFRTVNRAASFDYLRVYTLSNP